MQFFRRNRYRFFYPAGLISLVLLPLLGYFYLYQQEELQQKYVIEVNFWNPKNSSFFPDPSAQRKYKIITLTGNQNKDLQNLKQVQLQIQKLLSKKDTLNGIHILYGPKASYGTMISTFNIYFKERLGNKSLIGAPYKNNFWIFYRVPNLPGQMVDLSSCILYNDIAVEKPKISTFDIFLNEWNDFNTQLKQAKSFWPAGILYIIMVSLTAQKVVRQFRNQQRTTSN